MYAILLDTIAYLTPMPTAVPMKSSEPIRVKVKLSVETETSLRFVAVNKLIYQRLYELDQPSDKLVSIQYLGSELLQTPIVYQLRIDDKVPGDTLEVYDLTLLKRYGSSFDVEECLITTIDKLPHLDMTIISVPKEVYDISRHTSRDKMLNIISQETESSMDYVVSRKGDWYRSIHGRVVHSEPIEQGYVDRSTKIITVKGDESGLSPMVNASFDIDFTDLLGRDDSKIYDLKVHTLQADTITKFTRYNQMKPVKSIDYELYACMRSDTLSKLGILNGDTMKLAIKGMSVALHVLSFVDPCSFEEDTVYCSPILLLNLGWPSHIEIQKASKVLIPTASSITLSRVASPTNLERQLQQSVISGLRDYFQQCSRVSFVGQYIGIPIDAELARTIYTSYGKDEVSIPTFPDSDSPTNIAWLKVVGIKVNKESSKGPCLVDPSITKITEVGLSSETVSANRMDILETYLGLRPHFQYFHRNGKLVTFNYAEELRHIINTSFKIGGKIPFETTILLKSSGRSMGKATLVRSIAKEFGVTLLELDSYEVLNQASVGKTVGTIRGKADSIVESCPRLILFIKHIESLCKKGDPQNEQESRQENSFSHKIGELVDDYSRKGVIVIFSTNDPDSISDILRAKCKFEVNVTVPTDAERKLLLKYMITNQNPTDRYLFDISEDVSLESLSMQSAGLSPRDLASVVENAKTVAYDRTSKLGKDNGLSIPKMIALSGGNIQLAASDFVSAINRARDKNSDAIGAPKIPNVKWEDVGGLENVKGEILDTIDMPLKHPELFGNGVKKRSGILFYGPPGTGKTLLAKAIATNFSLNFFSVKGPELLNMYIGESEANVRKVFQKARDAKPCVIFFDELDSVAPKRGNQGDSGGVMDRIVSQLLAELDGMSDGNGDGVFVVGATNRPDLLDEALLRPGRFDKLLYLGISDTHIQQSKIIEALTRKFKLAPDFSALKVAEKCPFNYTGADFYALCSDSMLKAMIRTAETVDKKIKAYNASAKESVNTRYWFDHIATKEDVDVVVTAEDFDKARDELIPSVSPAELDHYLSVKHAFEND